MFVVVNLWTMRINCEINNSLMQIGLSPKGLHGFYQYLEVNF